MIGERIRQARMLAAMTQEEVATRLADAGFSITKAAISKYEKNKSTPPPQVLLLLAGILQVKTSYFWHESSVEIDWLAFRRHSNLPEKVQEAIKMYAADVAELQVELETLLYPDQRHSFPQPVEVSTLEEAEQVASNLRVAWGLGDGPIENLTQVAEDRGAIIIGWDQHPGDFDGLAGWCNRRLPVTVVNTAVLVDRRRFNLAHELGHLLMNSPGVSENDAEKLAHRFAAALLVPAEVAFRELGRRRTQLDLAELAVLKRKYGLSIQAWIFRATDLGIISSNYAGALWRELSSRGWRRHEPVEFVSSETPLRLEQMALRATSEGLMSSDRVEQVCPTGFSLEVSAPSLTSDLPSRRELLLMPAEEREKWMRSSFELAANDDTEVLEAFDEADFGDY